MKKPLFLLILLFLISLPLLSRAGRLNHIEFDNSFGISIYHQGCQLGQTIKETSKLIIPLQNCASQAEQFFIRNHNLKKIHWAQHDADTVWVVATFTRTPDFQIKTYADRYRICLPTCQELFNSLQQHTQPAPLNDVLFALQGIHFQMPLQGVSIDKFLDRSIGYIPEDYIRDGLPHFGSKRDDWKGKSRKHKGYDIYVDDINVLAAADGVVTQMGKGSRSGIYVKLYHGQGLYTVYVHLRSTPLHKGQKVRQGEVIGLINGAVGNAVAPQLHFEIKINDVSVDPLPLIENYYRTDTRLSAKIQQYKQQLARFIPIREQKVRALLSAQSE